MKRDSICIVHEPRRETPPRGLLKLHNHPAVTTIPFPEVSARYVAPPYQINKEKSGRLSYISFLEIDRVIIDPKSVIKTDSEKMTLTFRHTCIFKSKCTFIVKA